MWKNMLLCWIFYIYIALSGALCAEDLIFDWGKCSFGNDNSITLMTTDGKTCHLDACIVMPGWRFYSQQGMADAELKRENAQTVTLRGKLRAESIQLPFEAGFCNENGGLKIFISCLFPKELETQDKLGLLLVLKGGFESYENGLLRYGNKTSTFAKDNSWSSGKNVVLQPFGLEVTTRESLTYSLWSNHENKTWSLRCAIPRIERDDVALYATEIIIQKSLAPKLEYPVDMAELKRTQYRRLVYPPAEPQFDSSKICDLLNSPKLVETDIDRVEHALDIRSALYSWQDQLNHKPDDDSELNVLMRQGWDKLNHGDLDGAKAMYPELNKAFQDAPSWMPLVKFNPYSWIKAFTLNGFIKHPEGVRVCEPNPWCVTYQDGFRFSVAQTPGVSLSNTFSSDPNYYETRFGQSMAGVKVERSWVDTRWLLPDRKVRFSVLSPIIDIDETDTLELSGFSSLPDRLSYITPEGLIREIALRGESFEPEVIASVLIDNALPLVKATPTIGSGMRKLDPQQIGRPWLRLRSASGWNLLLLPGARPIEAGIIDGRFILKLEKKSYVGIVRLPPFLHFRECAAVGEFFSAVAAAYPVKCFEHVDGDAVEWMYEHEVRPNAWNIRPRKIAPVSPLAVLAGIPIPGLKRGWNMTKYGPFCFVDGDKVVFKLPKTLRTLPLKSGINERLQPDQLQKFTEQGADWIRLYFSGNDGIEEAYKELENTLKFCVDHNIKVLVDPHRGFGYKVEWTAGFPTEPAKEQIFLDLWDRVSKIGAKYPDAIAGYDLYNELGVKEGAEMRWKELAECCEKIIHSNHPDAMIYVTGMDGANPSGYFNYQIPDMAQDKLCVSFHYYTPHSFTHQKVSTRKDHDPFVFYPGYVPRTIWREKIHYGGTTVEWFDKWQIGATMLPLFELYAEKNIPLHCGEFGVVGYANRRAFMGAYFWTHNVIELFEHAGISYHLWNSGYGMGNARVSQLMYAKWRKTP